MENTNNPSPTPAKHTKKVVVAILGAFLVLISLVVQWMGITVNGYLSALCWVGAWILVRNLIYFSPISFSWSLILKRSLTFVFLIFFVAIIIQAFRVTTVPKDLSKEETIPPKKLTQKQQDILAVTKLLDKINELHISEQSGHPFRTNPATHFGVKAATCFGPIRPPLPVSLLRSF